MILYKQVIDNDRIITSSHIFNGRWPSGSGTLFVHEVGNTTMHTPMEMESASKWPAAVALVGLVDDHTIASLDSKVNSFVSWWSSDATDPR